VGYVMGSWGGQRDSVCSDKALNGRNRCNRGRQMCGEQALVCRRLERCNLARAVAGPSSCRDWAAHRDPLLMLQSAARA
jgi:hypothetical protein